MTSHFTFEHCSRSWLRWFCNVFRQITTWVSFLWYTLKFLDISNVRSFKYYTISRRWLQLCLVNYNLLIWLILIGCVFITNRYLAQYLLLPVFISTFNYLIFWFFQQTIICIGQPIIIATINSSFQFRNLASISSVLLLGLNLR